MIGWTRTGRLTAALMAAVVAAGCTTEPDAAPGPSTATTGATTAATSPQPASSSATPSPASSSPASSSPASRPAPSARPDLTAPQVMARGLEVPWGLAFLPGGAALVGERDTGRILRLTPGSAPRQVYDVPGVEASGEGGLLGIAVSPTFAQDNLVYAYYTGARDNRIVRFRLGAAEPEVIFDGIAKASFHNGGRIAFGPDGMLYVGTGDAGDTQRSQDRSSPNGKILRLSPDGAPARGNPTAGSPVYSLGHRNVQGLAWDSAGRLFATEFGQNQVDEVNLVEPGRNYGWPLVEGTGDTEGGRFTNPLVTGRPATPHLRGLPSPAAPPTSRPSAASGCGASRSTDGPPASPGPSSKDATAGCGRPRSHRTARCGSPRPTPTAAAIRGTATTASCGSRPAELVLPWPLSRPWLRSGVTRKQRRRVCGRMLLVEREFLTR